MQSSTSELLYGKKESWSRFPFLSSFWSLVCHGIFTRRLVSHKGKRSGRLKSHVDSAPVQPTVPSAVMIYFFSSSMIYSIPSKKIGLNSKTLTMRNIEITKLKRIQNGRIKNLLEKKVCLYASYTWWWYPLETCTHLPKWIWRAYLAWQIGYNLMAVSENPLVDLQTLILLWHIHSLYSQFIMIPTN